MSAKAVWQRAVLKFGLLPFVFVLIPFMGGAWLAFARVREWGIPWIFLIVVAVCFCTHAVLFKKPWRNTAFATFFTLCGAYAFVLMIEWLVLLSFYESGFKNADSPWPFSEAKSLWWNLRLVLGLSTTALATVLVACFACWGATEGLKVGVKKLRVADANVRQTVRSEVEFQRLKEKHASAYNDRSNNDAL